MTTKHLDPPIAIDAPAGEVRRLREMTLLYDISQLLDQSLDLRDVVTPVLEALANHVDMNHGTLTLLNRKTGDILTEVAHGLSPQQARRGRYRLGEGITGQVVQTGRPAIIPVKSKEPQFLNKTDRGKLDDTSFICVPITVGSEVVGALSIDRPQVGMPALENDARLLTVIASMIAQAVKLRRAAQEEQERLERENQRLRAELREMFRPSNIIGNSHEMQEVYDLIAQVAKSPATTMIRGETGTGKELVAHALHYNSDRADKPFIKAHCAALPEGVIESELFGHVQGAFTGATADRKGRFELAHGGTLFLDEIGDLSSAIQIKLLRVLQEREFERVGGTETIKVNVRLIVATHRDLLKLTEEGTFREDLYYRLNVFPIYVPPLRKRKSDIVLLADHFLQKYATENSKKVRRLSSAVIDMLMSYHWPGNVRELENSLERAVIVSDSDVVHPHHLPPTLQTAEHTSVPSNRTMVEQVADFERDIIRDTLKSVRGNMAAASRILGTTQRIVGYKVHKYGIEPKRYAQ
jgi:Nif-specific regulatory protein